MILVDAKTMYAVPPARVIAPAISPIGSVLAATLDKYEINTRNRIAHFLAQTCHESDQFHALEEYASGEAYEGRVDLGNTEPGDGPRYKGRGLIQLTGRANYARVGDALGLDLIGQPGLAAQPVHALQVACEYWKEHDINAAADLDTVVRVTRLINGGTNGLAERAMLTGRAKAAVLTTVAATQIGNVRAPGAPPLVHPTLYRGCVNPSGVIHLQSLLRHHGWTRLALDGDFGAATEMAVMDFQEVEELDIDGIVGLDTWGALETLTT